MPAIKMFAEGFAERSDVRVDLELSHEIGRLSPNMEISVFRIVQECVINVYRHSGSRTARIKIWPHPENFVNVQVCDEGKGMPSNGRSSGAREGNHGVGLSGMRERVRELGGTFEIKSNGKGTTVTAALPLMAAPAHTFEN